MRTIWFQVYVPIVTASDSKNKLPPCSGSWLSKSSNSMNVFLIIAWHYGMHTHTRQRKQQTLDFHLLKYELPPCLVNEAWWIFVIWFHGWSSLCVCLSHRTWESIWLLSSYYSVHPGCWSMSDWVSLRSQPWTHLPSLDSSCLRHSLPPSYWEELWFLHSFSAMMRDTELSAKDAGKVRMCLYVETKDN